MATIRPQWTATLLATGVRHEPRIEHRINNLSAVASVLLGTILLTVFMPALWAESTQTHNKFNAVLAYTVQTISVLFLYHFFTKGKRKGFPILHTER